VSGTQALDFGLIATLTEAALKAGQPLPTVEGNLIAWDPVNQKEVVAQQAADVLEWWRADHGR
jgi:hypothetical protein